MCTAMFKLFFFLSHPDVNSINISELSSNMLWKTRLLESVHVEQLPPKMSGAQLVAPAFS